MANKCINAATAAEIISQYTGIPLHQLVDIMAEVPSEDVEHVRHGYWEQGDIYDMGDVCSLCQYDSNREPCTYKYCPNCGAKMNGKENDNDQR